MLKVQLKQNHQSSSLFWAKVLLLLLSSTFAFLSEANNSIKEVRMGTEKEGWPFSFKDTDGLYKGFGIDLLEYIGKEQGWKFEKVTGTFQELHPQLNSADIDILFPFSNDLQNESILINEPFIIAWGGFFAQQSEQINSVFHINGFRVAIIKNDFFGKKIQELTDQLELNLTILLAEDIDTAFQLVKDGKADAAAVEENAGSFLATDYNLKKIGVNYGYTTGHFSVSKKIGKEFAQKLHTTLVNLRRDKNSYYYVLLEKWYGKLITIPTPPWVSTFIINVSIILFLLSVFTALLIYQLRQKSNEIENRKKIESELEHRAFHDDLTNLSNRRLLLQNILSTIESHDDNKKKLFVLFFDVDNFKRVNDTKGHVFGDQLLQSIGARLSTFFSNGYTLARFGGDEFVILADEKLGHNITESINNIGQVFFDPFKIDNMELYVTVCIGISTYPDNGQNATELIKNADTALYYGKASGKNTCTFYNSLLHEKDNEKLALEYSLRKSVDEGLCVPFYQPLVNLEDGKIIGAEALFRCFHPDSKNSNTELLISIAEETGLIVDIGKLMLLSACKQFKIWQDEGFNLQYISVNVSLEQIYRTDVLQMVNDVLDEVGLDPAYLVLEVTEAVFMKDPEQALSIFQKLRDTGVRLALDDFGTGYSSLSYIKSLPFSIIKLDQIFTKGLPDNMADVALIETIISLGRFFNMKILAEGVETQKQAEILKEMDCLLAQGYFFGKPASANDFHRYIESQKSIR